ncbi:hypothetical protein PtrSN002B_001348 [Pyrenophora tritici-repentis]|uniref:Uncharacterized protein n=1 Tax=Pyrenophora tritici-repentis TaxID=45151 RepID=A0A2W1DL59_9PLEO|nr:hypothetical protein PtrV1_02240 [Pyrenophora tritici-repentis]KAF7578142.1 hypothetical protein PtrM4_023820 [Pyrenophora tritici-repentis]KAI0578201.1 hypothetical protein Alg215_06468 [Pyrenophora tritici-repentis]KAI1518147.1 hypothetical protein Ptr86124_003448 [Pyrenophora tritici-repentis]KAI1545228.1 hypothetical protein PtrSN001A_002405 [Pyrenophora tritici-repentis]
MAPIMLKKIIIKKNLIEELFASWTDLEEVVDIEMCANPNIKPFTKACTKLHYTTHDLPPIACLRLPAARIPEAIVKINASRNNPELFEYFINNDPYLLAQRVLLQAQFESHVRVSKYQTYLFAEEGEPIVQVNGRPLTDIERAQLEFNPRAVDLRKTLPVDKQMKKGVEMILPEYTLYSIMAKEDSLVTTGCILPSKGQGTSEDSSDDVNTSTKTSLRSSLSSALDLRVEGKTEVADIDKPGTESINKERQFGDGLELCIFAFELKEKAENVLMMTLSGNGRSVATAFVLGIHLIRS